MKNKKHLLYKIIFVTLHLFVYGYSFSQVALKDSIHYFEHLKQDLLFGNDIRGKSMPDFIVMDRDEHTFSNRDFNSKITFINFWFEACAPCHAEFQALEKFYNKNKNRKNFQFISITYESDSVIKEVREKYKLSYPIYRMSYDSCRKVKFNLGYPANLIIDKTGAIVYSVAGGPVNPDEADKFINHFVQGELDKQFN